MTRRYGRAPRGERVAEGTPAGQWRTLTLLSAMSPQGMLAAMTVEAPALAAITPDNAAAWFAHCGCAIHQ